MGSKRSCILSPVMSLRGGVKSPGLEPLMGGGILSVGRGFMLMPPPLDPRGHGRGRGTLARHPPPCQRDRSPHHSSPDSFWSIHTSPVNIKAPKISTTAPGPRPFLILTGASACDGNFVRHYMFEDRPKLMITGDPCDPSSSPSASVRRSPYGPVLRPAPGPGQGLSRR